jgi:hypothetical protein
MQSHEYLTPPHESVNGPLCESTAPSPTFGYCSFPASSGKTHCGMRRAVDLVLRGERILYVGPTTDLLDQVERDLKTILEERGLDHRSVLNVMHRKSVARPARCLVEHSVSDAGREPQIVLATHQVLPYVYNEMHDAGDWVLIHDEVPQVVRCDRIRVPRTHSLFTDHFYLDETDEGGFRRVLPIDEEAVREVIRNSHRDYFYDERGFRRMMDVLAKPGHDAWVDGEQYQKLLDGRGEYLEVHSVMRPNVLGAFKSPLIMGACLEYSLAALVWEAVGVEFRRDEELTRQMRFEQHPNGELLTVYFSDDRPWSRRTRETVDADGRRNDERYLDAVLRHAGDASVLVQANADLKIRLVDGRVVLVEDAGEDELPKNWRRAPNVPHGRNDFSAMDAVAMSSSLNPSPGHTEFLRSVFEIDPEDVRRGMVHVAAYQLVTRIIRDPECRERKVAYVPDSDIAEFLARYFPGLEFEVLPVKFARRPVLVETAKKSPGGRPRSENPSPGAVRVRRHRARVRAANDQG